MSDELAHHPFEPAHREPAHPTDRVRRPAALGEPAADHQVGSVAQRSEDGCDRLRVVLAVGVELHRGLVAVLDRVAEPGAEGAADPEVERKLDNRHACGPGDACRPVGGTVGDDEHVEVGTLLQELLEHGRQGHRFVVRGDDDQGPRGSRRPPAAAGARHPSTTGASSYTNW